MTVLIVENRRLSVSGWPSDINATVGLPQQQPGFFCQFCIAIVRLCACAFLITRPTLCSCVVCEYVGSLVLWFSFFVCLILLAVDWTLSVSASDCLEWPSSKWPLLTRSHIHSHGGCRFTRWWHPDPGLSSSRDGDGDAYVQGTRSA